MRDSHSEIAWLSGEDIFSGLLRDPHDPFSDPTADMMYALAFG